MFNPMFSYRISYQRALVILLGLVLMGTWPAEGQTIYPTEPPGQQSDLPWLSKVGHGQYVPLRLKRPDEKRVEKFETSFEECAPGRNSAANEWSAFGAIGNMDFNAMGRELWVRYPAFELKFRLQGGDSLIEPGQLESFRLGLINNRLPAIWGGWQHEGLLYKVSVMTVPSPECGNFDLYKLEIQNPTDRPLPSKLVTAVDGPPDMHLADGILRGLGENVFLIADATAKGKLQTRDTGWCDKRAKAAASGSQIAFMSSKSSINSCRLGFDGLPVAYRFKAQAAKKYVVCLAAPARIADYHHLPAPQRSGDLVVEYRVEGCAAQTRDCFDWTKDHRDQPLFLDFEGARDVNGDGAIEVSAGLTAASRLRLTQLGAIWVFPEGTTIDKPESVTGGALKGKCVSFMDVGATPEQEGYNQNYDKSDKSFAFMQLDYNETIPAGQTKTYWLRVPPIHRRQPVSMRYVAHAFRDVLPGEAVPPFEPEKVKTLRELDPLAAERQVADYWAAFFDRAARFEIPDPILNDIFLSRLATRAILDVNIDKDLSYNACSPFYYFDHAYRDLTYVIYSEDLAGKHDHTERLLRVFCKDVKDVPLGPIAFDGKPLQLGMLENGLWQTRTGQWDTQGQNIWALVQHYKLTGDRNWLKKTAYPYIRRGALWLINSRHKHMAEVKDVKDPRYGLLEPGAMEVINAGKGMHMYYLNAFGVLGLREAAEAAKAVGKEEDARLFTAEGLDLKKSLYQSFQQTFRRNELYDGHIWFGVEPEGVGMYGFWAHNCLVWPCRSIDPQDPMITATLRHMERMSDTWGGGMHAESPGDFWPYIGVDRAMSHLVRGERERALDYFCAYTDTAGGTLSWGEGYSNVTATGDQPHFWADANWIILYRSLFAFEDGSSLWLTPALPRRWHEPGRHVDVSRLATHFGDLDLKIEPRTDGQAIDYVIQITPQGDQETRALERIVLYPRIPGGRAIAKVTLGGKEVKEFTRDTLILPSPDRKRKILVSVQFEPW